MWPFRAARKDGRNGQVVLEARTSKFLSSKRVARRQGIDWMSLVASGPLQDTWGWNTYYCLHQRNNIIQ